MATIRNIGTQPANASDFVLDAVCEFITDGVMRWKPLTQVLVMGAQHWGRGENVHEAVTNSEWMRDGDPALVCMVDAGAYVDDHGSLRYETRSTVYEGVITRSKGCRYNVAILREVQPRRSLS